MRNKIDAILLDMDGVIVNLLHGLLRAHGRLDLYERWPIGVYNIPGVLQMSGSDFWDPIAALGSEFWRTLPALPWMMELWSRLTSVAREVGAELHICTSPTLDPGCLKGKLEWLQEAFGQRSFRNFVMTPQKHLLATDRTILIDDSQDNVINFCRAGGFALLDRKSTRLNSSHTDISRMPSSA